mmetsp:Transcript_46990/g.56539  ORF Transcript_46990/g.56539 Transcript_46990/m.56539 type:complete len:384 (-) Transcript_46990:170-1321(-)
MWPQSIDTDLERINAAIDEENMKNKESYKRSIRLVKKEEYYMFHTLMIASLDTPPLPLFTSFHPHTHAQTLSFTTTTTKMPAISFSSAEAASQRRQTRLRREYLYRKSLEGQTRASYDQKRLVRESLANGTSLPTESRTSYDKLQQGIEAEDDKTQEFGVRSHVDDEYGDAGLVDPRVYVTTSRDPSSRLKQFAKELKLLIPNATRINRGGNRVDALLSSCQDGSFTDLVMVQETRGEPDGLVVCHLPLGPTAYFTLSNAVLRHDLEGRASPMSEAVPHILLNNFNSDLGKRIGNVLKCLFPVPKPDTRRVITFSNDDDFISFRHHMYTKEGGMEKEVTLHEVGPRFEMRLYQLRLGTLDQTDAENEYVLRPYQNTAAKRQVL